MQCDCTMCFAVEIDCLNLEEFLKNSLDLTACFHLSMSNTAILADATGICAVTREIKSTFGG